MIQNIDYNELRIEYERGETTDFFIEKYGLTMSSRNNGSVWKTLLDYYGEVKMKRIRANRVAFRNGYKTHDLNEPVRTRAVAEIVEKKKKPIEIMAELESEIEQIENELAKNGYDDELVERLHVLCVRLNAEDMKAVIRKRNSVKKYDKK